MTENGTFSIDWRKAAVDVLLIVVGVSIALTADSWLAERTERKRTDQLLIALEAEWTTELENLGNYIAAYDLSMDAIIRMVGAHRVDEGTLTDTEAASLLQQAYNWKTFNPSEGALNTLLADGIQNIENIPLRTAIASWRATLGNLTAEQAALRQLGAVGDPLFATIVAQKSNQAFPANLAEYSRSMYGLEQGVFANAAIADDDWIANQRQILDMLYRYQRDMISVQQTLEHNLTLLRKRTGNNSTN